MSYGSRHVDALNCISFLNSTPTNIDGILSHFGWTAAKFHDLRCSEGWHMAEQDLGVVVPRPLAPDYIYEVKDSYWEVTHSTDIVVQELKNCLDVLTRATTSMQRIEITAANAKKGTTAQKHANQAIRLTQGLQTNLEILVSMLEAQSV